MPYTGSQLFFLYRDLPLDISQVLRRSTSPQIFDPEDLFSPHPNPPIHYIVCKIRNQSSQCPILGNRLLQYEQIPLRHQSETSLIYEWAAINIQMQGHFMLVPIRIQCQLPPILTKTQYRQNIMYYIATSVLFDSICMDPNGLLRVSTSPDD